MVFGARLAEAIARGQDGPTATGAMRSAVGAAAVEGVIAGRAVTDGGDGGPAATPSPTGSTRLGGVPSARSPDDVTKLRDRLQQAMTEGAGVVRSARSLHVAAAILDEVDAGAVSGGTDGSGVGEVAYGELQNLLTVSRAVLRSAERRRESRGAHRREEFPAPDPGWRCRLVHGGPAAGRAR
jgi:L-aspartate oxidase